MIREILDDMLGNFDRGEKIALAAFAIVLIIYVCVLSYFQNRSMNAYLEAQSAWYESTVEVAPGHRVNKDDYEAANARWKEEHPEPHPFG